MTKAMWIVVVAVMLATAYAATAEKAPDWFNAFPIPYHPNELERL